MPPPTVVDGKHYVFESSGCDSVGCSSFNECTLAPVSHDAISLYLVQEFQ